MDKCLTAVSTQDNHMECLPSLLCFQIVFDDPEILAHAKTTNEIKECCKDIKVLGRKDLRMLLSWWKTLHGEDEKPTIASQETEEENKDTKKDVDSSDEEEIDKHISELQVNNIRFRTVHFVNNAKTLAVDTFQNRTFSMYLRPVQLQLVSLFDIDQLENNKRRSVVHLMNPFSFIQAEEHRELKRKKKKTLKERKKLNERLNLKMVIKGDDGPTMESDDMFSLKQLSSANQVTSIVDQAPDLVAESDDEEAVPIPKYQRYQKDEGRLDSSGTYYKDSDSELEMESEGEDDEDVKEGLGMSIYHFQFFEVRSFGGFSSS